MLITKENQKEIKDNIYIHDSYFENIYYNYDEQILKMDLDNPFIKKSFIITFNNILFTQIQNFNFWGKDDGRIIDWSLSEDWDIIKSVFDYEFKRDGRYPDNEAQDVSEYIFSCLYLSSGNTFHILCKEIEFTSTDYPPKVN